MNQNRRKELNAAIDLIQKMSADWEKAAQIIRDAADEEQEGFDNMSEGLQQGERGQRMEEVANILSEIADEMEAVDLADMITRLDDAKA